MEYEGFWCKSKQKNKVKLSIRCCNYIMIYFFKKSFFLKLQMMSIAFLLMFNVLFVSKVIHGKFIIYHRLILIKAKFQYFTMHCVLVWNYVHIISLLFQSVMINFFLLLKLCEFYDWYRNTGPIAIYVVK